MYRSFRFVAQMRCRTTILVAIVKSTTEYSCHSSAPAANRHRPACVQINTAAVKVLVVRKSNPVTRSR